MTRTVRPPPPEALSLSHSPPLSSFKLTNTQVPSVRRSPRLNDKGTPSKPVGFYSESAIAARAEGREETPKKPRKSPIKNAVKGHKGGKKPTAPKVAPKVVEGKEDTPKPSKPTGGKKGGKKTGGKKGGKKTGGKKAETKGADDIIEIQECYW